jgi:hypothetical protein
LKGCAVHENNDIHPYIQPVETSLKRQLVIDAVQTIKDFERIMGDDGSAAI